MKLTLRFISHILNLPGSTQVKRNSRIPFEYHLKWMVNNDMRRLKQLLPTGGKGGGGGGEYSDNL